MFLNFSGFWKNDPWVLGQALAPGPGLAPPGFPFRKPEKNQNYKKKKQKLVFRVVFCVCVCFSVFCYKNKKTKKTNRKHQRPGFLQGLSVFADSCVFSDFQKENPWVREKYVLVAGSGVKWQPNELPAAATMIHDNFLQLYTYARPMGDSFFVRRFLLNSGEAK